jgi:hypothetical protein
MIQQIRDPFNADSLHAEMVAKGFSQGMATNLAFKACIFTPFIY